MTDLTIILGLITLVGISAYTGYRSMRNIIIRDAVNNTVDRLTEAKIIRMIKNNKGQYEIYSGSNTYNTYNGE